MPAIEIVPWIHAASAQAHQDLVQDVRRWPKGATVFLEITPERLRQINSILEGDFEKDQRAARTSEKEAAVLALVELLFACRTRGIRVIPIETPVGYENALRKKRYAEERMASIRTAAQISAIIATSISREKQFAEQIRSFIPDQSKGQYFAVVGLNHAGPLQKALSPRMQARLRTDFFSEQPLIERAIKIWSSIRETYEKDNAGEAGRLRRQGLNEKEIELYFRYVHYGGIVSKKVLRLWEARMRVGEQFRDNSHYVHQSLDPILERRKWQQRRWKERGIRKKNRKGKNRPTTKNV